MCTVSFLLYIDLFGSFDGRQILKGKATTNLSGCRGRDGAAVTNAL